MKILPIYAALLAFLFVALSVRTLLLRRKFKVAIGDGGNQKLLRAMRVHANFAEYVPLCLFLIYLVELQSAPSLMIHALGICLLAGRFSHAFGLSRLDENLSYRVFGMATTFATIISSAVFLLFTAIFGH